MDRTIKAQISPPQISFIVPVINAGKTIAETLKSVFGQTGNHIIEVIVIDNGSTDSTQEMARQFPVRLLSCEKRGPSAARNVGLRAAQGQFVVFLDGDVILCPGWLDLAVQNLMGSLWDVVQGPNIPVGKNGLFMTRMREQLISHFTRSSFNYLRRSIDGFPQLNTAAFAMKRKIIVDKKLSFDESLLRCEDSDFTLQLLFSGCHLKEVPEMKSFVSDHRSPASYLYRIYLTGKYSGILTGRWKAVGNATRLFNIETNSLAMKLYFLLMEGAFILGRKCAFPPFTKGKIEIQKMALNGFLFYAQDKSGVAWQLDPTVRIVCLADKIVLFRFSDFGKMVLNAEEKRIFEATLFQKASSEADELVQRMKDAHFLIPSGSEK